MVSSRRPAMKMRCDLVSASVAALIGALALSAAVGAQGQPPAKPGPAPGGTSARTATSATTGLRTPWGAPDLQGIWSNPVVVPLERPKQFGTRQLLTEEEHAKAVRDLLERNKRPGRDS